MAREFAGATTTAGSCCPKPPIGSDRFHSPDQGIASFLCPTQSNVIFELFRPLRTGPLVGQVGCAAQLGPGQPGWMPSQGLLNRVSEGGVGHCQKVVSGEMKFPHLSRPPLARLIIGPRSEGVHCVLISSSPRPASWRVQVPVLWHCWTGVDSQVVVRRCRVFSARNIFAGQCRRG